MKAYKLEMLIVDHDDLGASGVREAIENQRFANDAISPHVMAIAERDIGEWDDSHPLNHYSKMQAEYQRLFSLDQPEQVDAESAQKECRKYAERDLPPLPELTILGTSRYGSIFLGYTADQMRERDAMWQARINALLSKQAPVTDIDSVALDVSRKIMSVVNGSWLPRGAPQVQAKIQCILTELLSSAQPSRAAILEEAASVCDAQHDRARTSPGAARADACARAIRALGAQPKGEKK